MTTINGINGQATTAQSYPDDLVVNGGVDGQSTAQLTSTGGFILLKDKIDGQSTASLQAATDITVNGKIDGQSSVTMNAGGNITIKDKIDGQCIVTLIATGDIVIQGKVDGQSIVGWKGASFKVNGGVGGGSDVYQQGG